MANSAMIEDRKKAYIEGASAVVGFDEKGVYFLIEEERAEITGKNLEITSFDSEKKKLVVEGDITALNYKGKKESITKRIFK